MKKLLCLLLVCGNALAQQSTLKQSVVTLRPLPSGVDSSAMIQGAIDSFPRVTDIFSGQGGGKIVLGAGTYTLTTNIVFPNYFPYCLEFEGAGSFGSTLLVLKNTHQDKTKAYISGATNFVNGINLTNTLKLTVHGIAFAQEDMLSTNFILGAFGWIDVHDNLFTTMYGLTNGQGGYSLNWEANVPNQPIGCAGVLANNDISDAGNFGGTGANGLFDCYNNRFYCLANGLTTGSVVNHVHHNYFSDQGVYNDNAPPTVNNTTLHLATNLWLGSVSGVATPMSSGASIVTVGAGDNTWIDHNLFFGCGLCCFGNPHHWFDNFYSLTGYRIADNDNLAIEEASALIEEVQPGSGFTLGTAAPDDVHLTNNVASTKLSPDGGHTFGGRARTGLAQPILILNKYSQNGGPLYFGFSGGPIISTNGFWSSQSVAAASTAISFPNTTVNWTNSQAFNIVLYLNNSGVTVTSISKNGQQIFGSLANDTTLALKPGDYFSEAYTGSPSARWEPQ